MTPLEQLSERIARREARIAVIGLGYVGLPLALAFTRAAFRVIGVDRDAERVAELQAGRSYIEDVPGEEIAAAVETELLEVSATYDGLDAADCIHVCVPTPLTKTKEPDVSYIVSAVEEIQAHLRPGQLVLLGSTTYPGTTHELYRPILEGSGLQVGEDLALAFAPERIDPGNADWAFSQVPKVVGGETEGCTRLAVALFETIFERVVPVSSSRSAEMVKLLENTFRMINIGLVNEVAVICDRLGLDVWEVIDAASTKPYGFMKFVPGPGLGGHCIPVDPNYLTWKMRTLDFNARFIELASDINAEMPNWVVDRIVRILNRARQAVNGSRILLLGMAFKADVADPRESPALDIATSLLKLGADVSYHDPWIPEVRIEGQVHKSVELTDEVIHESDLVVITTGHSGIDYARIVREAAFVFDTRNATRDLGPAGNVEKL